MGSHPPAFHLTSDNLAIGLIVIHDEHVPAGQLGLCAVKVAAPNCRRGSRPNRQVKGCSLAWNACAFDPDGATHEFGRVFG